MLWQYTEILFIVASLTTILCFHKNIEKIGQVFFMFVGAAAWFGFAVSLLKITFKWGGSTSVVSYTYIPSTESGFIYLFGSIGLIMLIIGILRAFELTYKPVVDYGSMMLEEKTKPWQEV